MSEIIIRRESSTALASNEYDLVYRPDQGYTIQTLQENKAAEPLRIHITGNFQ